VLTNIFDPTSAAFVVPNLQSNKPVFAITTFEAMLGQVYFLESVLAQTSSSWWHEKVNHVKLINASLQCRQQLAQLCSSYLLLMVAQTIR
jgi:hypothetical protein